jgi:ppGpp synthetase/RelA/SpoT-type nucleotidyltranferase
MNIKIEDQIQFIKEFENKRVDWIDYANFLNDVLNEAVQKLSLLAIVQCRPKGVISFANKIISKDKYKEPLKDITDLCGARVIVHFQSQVEKVCDFIKDNFEIDEANSLDLRSRLEVNEFGYRSIHYIVTPKSDLIIRNPKYQKFKSMKAEIQVRTLAEHIWADISHDRIYKTDLHIPDEWGREAARLSAMLEKADQSFAQMAQEIDTATKVFDLQYQQEKAKNDIQKFETLIQVLVGSPLEQVKNALKLTEIYRAQNELKKATELFKEFINPVFLKEVTDAFFKAATVI